MHIRTPEAGRFRRQQETGTNISRLAQLEDGAKVSSVGHGTLAELKIAAHLVLSAVSSNGVGIAVVLLGYADALLLSHRVLNRFQSLVSRAALLWLF